jgi:hypothetical protein
MKTGVANLSLHYGKTLAWLFSRMRELARREKIEALKRLKNIFI